LFLGKKTDLEGLNLHNLEKGISMADAAFDKTLAKYLEGMQEQAGYLPPDRRAEYLTGRLRNIGGVLDKFVSKKQSK